MKLAIMFAGCVSYELVSALVSLVAGAGSRTSTRVSVWSRSRLWNLAAAPKAKQLDVGWCRNVFWNQALISKLPTAVFKVLFETSISAMLIPLPSSLPHITELLPQGCGAQLLRSDVNAFRKCWMLYAQFSLDINLSLGPQSIRFPMRRWNQLRRHPQEGKCLKICAKLLGWHRPSTGSLHVDSTLSLIFSSDFKIVRTCGFTRVGMDSRRQLWLPFHFFLCPYWS